MLPYVHIIYTVRTHSMCTVRTGAYFNITLRILVTSTMHVQLTCTHLFLKRYASSTNYNTARYSLLTVDLSQVLLSRTHYYTAMHVKNERCPNEK